MLRANGENFTDMLRASGENFTDMLRANGSTSEAIRDNLGFALDSSAPWTK